MSASGPPGPHLLQDPSYPLGAGRPLWVTPTTERARTPSLAWLILTKRTSPSFAADRSIACATAAVADRRESRHKFFAVQYCENNLSDGRTLIGWRPRNVRRGTLGMHFWLSLSHPFCDMFAGKECLASLLNQGTTMNRPLQHIGPMAPLAKVGIRSDSQSEKGSKRKREWEERSARLNSAKSPSYVSCGRFRMTGNSAARGMFPVMIMVKRPQDSTNATRL